MAEAQKIKNKYKLNVTFFYWSVSERWWSMGAREKWDQLQAPNSLNTATRWHNFSTMCVCVSVLSQREWEGRTNLVMPASCFTLDVPPKL